MALTLTLAESLKLTTNTLQAGVIETLAKESKILAVLPFMNVQGSGYSYNVETGLSEAKFREVGAAIVAGTVAFKQRTEALKILGDEAIIDKFQIQTYGDKNDLMALEVGLKVKAMGNKYEKTFISGDSSKVATEFDGIEKRLIADQRVAGTDVIADDVDALLDKIQGDTDALIMNKTTRRKFVADNRKYITWNRNEFGVNLASYGGIDILDLEDEVLKENGAIYAVQFGAKSGVCGLQNGGIQVTTIGEMEAAPQIKTRIEWYTGLAVFNDKTIAKITPAVKK